METSLENLEDGMVKITVQADGYVEEGWVSSHHLVPAKEIQLMHCIYKRAQQDFCGDTAPCDI